MESFHFLHASHIAYVWLYTNVSNSAELRNRIISAASNDQSERDALNFAFIEASLVTSKLHLRTAIHQALLSYSQNGLRTKTVHSEVLWALNPSNNISEAIKRYGVSPTSTSLLVVRISPVSTPVADVEDHLRSLINGTLRPLSELENVTNWDLVAKYNKLGGIVADKARLDKIVVSAVAMNGVWVIQLGGQGTNGLHRMEATKCTLVTQ